MAIEDARLDHVDACVRERERAVAFPRRRVPPPRVGSAFPPPSRSRLPPLRARGRAESVPDERRRGTADRRDLLPPHAAAEWDERDDVPPGLLVNAAAPGLNPYAEFQRHVVAGYLRAGP